MTPEELEELEQDLRDWAYAIAEFYFAQGGEPRHGEENILTCHKPYGKLVIRR